MQNFVYHNPTKVIFGRDGIDNIGREAAFFGSKALLIYGCGSIKKHHTYDKITASLDQAGIKTIEHGGVSPNPRLSHVEAGVRIAKENNIEVIVAVGGGSVLDSAKAIAAGALVQHQVWQFFRAKKGVKAKLPLICLSTLAASGSEMNSGMVLTNEDTKQKSGIGSKHLFPNVAILDPTLTYTVPANYTAYGAVDALCHILEFYFTSPDPATPVQDRIIEGLAINIMASCIKAINDPEDYQARADLMWCSALALNGLTNSGLGRVAFPMHMMEHSLSALFDIPHGAGLAAIMPAWMQYQTKINPAKFAQFAARVFAEQGKCESKLAARGIYRLKEWLATISCPTSLNDLNIGKDQIPAIANNALFQAKIWRLREYDQKKIEKIYHLCCF